MLIGALWRFNEVKVVGKSDKDSRSGRVGELLIDRLKQIVLRTLLHCDLTTCSVTWARLMSPHFHPLICFTWASSCP